MSFSQLSISPKWGKLPTYQAILPDKVVGDIRSTITSLEERIKTLEEKITNSTNLSWDDVFGTLESIDITLEETWSPLNHLSGVKNADYRDAHNDALKLVVDFNLKLSQSELLFKAFKSFKEGPQWANFNAVQKRIVEKRIKAAELAGISLQGESRDQFNKIVQDLSLLSKKFEDNVIDYVKSWGMDIDPKENPEYASLSEQLPESLRHFAHQSWREHTKKEEGDAKSGPWRFTVDGPSYVAFMTNCGIKQLRETFWKGYCKRASHGETDNSPLILDILRLRGKQANLLGYKDYSEVSLATKMAKSKAEVYKLLERLRDVSQPTAKKELQDLKDWASKSGDNSELRQWDIPFYAKRLQEERYSYKEEELRKYFPYQSVVNGLFGLVEEIFNIKVTLEDSPDVPVWHKDVKFYLIQDKSTGKDIAGFYLDPYTRPSEKKGGAWMDICRSRIVDNKGEVTQIPIAYLICNVTPPADNSPSQLLFSEVETLFHEFGHGLQHMLTKAQYLDVAGINGIEWDAVELPSQFMENWCYHKPTLKGMTKHVQTGEALPEDLFQKIVQSRTYRSASQMLRQLNFGFLDLELHTSLKIEDEDKSTDKIFELQRNVYNKTDIITMHPDDKTPCSFSHIFAGGYACGYYSYKWAEVLSADAFYAFVEEGLDNPDKIKEVGKLFRDTILSEGGGRDPMDVFKSFRGREPNPDSLLKQENLL
eukprot:TRINITY_DN6286_c0_g1_i1.p1 TRINITY_DN6286_c0_g1~~TRINITY_DN6286_c0_g1_i1.p1  ORF type:complete len:736 (+),score=168.46 TRINITY_DN6286_c0_g1_i1:87-2210(+)